MSGLLDLPRLPIVLGAGRSGLAAAAALADAGREVTLVDDDPAGISGAPVPVVGPAEVEYEGCEAIIRSPGVPNGHPVLQAAHERGIPIWSEVELGYRLLPPGARVVGITGTNGKTTTTELVGAMLYEAGLPHQVCGNVGIALCEVAPLLPEGAIVVCELSSFQLEDIISFHCDAAALTNITPDHLDRHGSIEEYQRIKLRIFETQDEHGRPMRFGSVGGGGRYDGLVARFRGEPVPATGFSIGVSRLLAALTAIGSPIARGDAARGPVVVLVLDRAEMARYQGFVAQLRAAGIRAELYLGAAGMNAQMKYADKRRSVCAVIQGSNERDKGEISIRDLVLGAELAASTKDRADYLELRARAQFSAPEADLLAAVKDVLGRHS